MNRNVTEIKEGVKVTELQKLQEDLAFGTKVLGNSMRLLNHDGSFNVERCGITRY